MELIRSSVVRARVVHTRRAPVSNRFVYDTDYLLLDEAALGKEGGPALFSFGRPNLISLYPSDHGISGYAGADGMRRLATGAGIHDTRHILLLVHPRYWGYTFNPVSFWFFLGESLNLRAVLAEVHNTFGERHGYFCVGANGADITRNCWTVSTKCFHVSPYFDVKGEYRFRFLLDETRVAVRIVYEDGAGGGLDTAIAGTRRPFSDRELARALIRRPCGAMRTTTLIHWQALRLWYKGLRYRRRPAPPKRNIT